MIGRTNVSGDYGVGDSIYIENLQYRTPIINFEEFDLHYPLGNSAGTYSDVVFYGNIVKANNEEVYYLSDQYLVKEVYNQSTNKFDVVYRVNYQIDASTQQWRYKQVTYNVNFDLGIAFIYYRLNNSNEKTMLQIRKLSDGNLIASKKDWKGSSKAENRFEYPHITSNNLWVGNANSIWTKFDLNFNVLHTEGGNYGFSHIIEIDSNKFFLFNMQRFCCIDGNNNILSTLDRWNNYQFTSFFNYHLDRLYDARIEKVGNNIFVGSFLLDMNSTSNKTTSTSRRFDISGNTINNKTNIDEYTDMLVRNEGGKDVLYKTGEFRDVISGKFYYYTGLLKYKNIDSTLDRIYKNDYSDKNDNPLYFSPVKKALGFFKDGYIMGYNQTDHKIVKIYNQFNILN